MDTAALVELLETSFRLWGVRASAEAVPGRGLAARVEAQGRAPIGVSRAVEGDEALPVWRLAASSATCSEHASLGALLLGLREELDASFVAGAAIIGIRPTTSPAGDTPRAGSGRS